MEQLKSMLDSMVKKYGEEAAREALIKAEQQLSLNKHIGDIENPFMHPYFNLTKQAELQKHDPDLARLLKREAELKK